MVRARVWRSSARSRTSCGGGPVGGSPPARQASIADRSAASFCASWLATSCGERAAEAPPQPSRPRQPNAAIASAARSVRLHCTCGLIAGPDLGCDAVPGGEMAMGNGLTLELTRTLPADRAAVWEAMTDPDR